MSDVVDGLKALSLHGMASAWPEVLGTARLKALDHEVVLHQLIKSEAAQREVRSMAYQMRVARFPAHRDLTGFDFAQAHVDANLVKQLHELQFVDSAHNVVFVGGPGTGKTHLATSLGVHAIRAKAKRVRFFSTVELVNALELEKSQNKHGQLANRLMYVDLVILDEMGYLPFTQSGGALLFHLLSKLYLLLHALSALEPLPGKLLLLSPIVGEFSSDEIGMGFIPPYATRLHELASQGLYPAPSQCEIHVGEQDWQSKPDNVSAFAKLVNAHVTVVEDAGHSLPKEYVGALLDRWLD